MSGDEPATLLPRAAPRTPRLGLAIAGLVLAVWAFVGLSAFVLTRSVEADPNQTYDAVVVLATGSGERLQTGLELVDRGAAPRLVISNGANGTWYDAGRICSAERSIDVDCPVPDPVDTRGEIGMVRQLIETEQWQRVLIVTSSYHRLRVDRMVGQCGIDDVDVVGMSPQISLATWTRRLIHEIGGNLATTVVRGCL